MKKLIATIILLANLNFAFAQNINWQTINENQKEIVYLNFGYDFGMTTQLGYGYLLNTSKQILLTADYSFPMGNDLFDDFKIRLGGQMPVFKKNNFVVSVKLLGITRRHETSLVRMYGFGSEFSILGGIYKPKWHLAGELGFDKSIITHLKHTDQMRDNFPEIIDAWFIPSGGQFYYGIQGSKTIRQHLELSLRLGAINAQSDDENPLLPFYGQLGFIWKFSSKGVGMKR